MLNKNRRSQHARRLHSNDNAREWNTTDLRRIARQLDGILRKAQTFEDAVVAGGLESAGAAACYRAA